MNSLGFLRNTALSPHLSSEGLLSTIRRMVGCRLDESLLELCAKSDAVNLAVDGWYDRRGRRYQGIVVRFSQHEHHDSTTRFTCLEGN
jgi:hypothetical protein